MKKDNNNINTDHLNNQYSQHEFYHRFVNLSNVNFSKEESEF